MRAPTQRRTTTLLLVSIVVLGGCIGSTPGNPAEPQSDSPMSHTEQPTTTGTLTNSETDDGKPHATLRSFERVTSECLDNTGLGGNTTAHSTDNGTRIVLNRTIKTQSPNATLNASLSSNDSNPTTWTLHIKSNTTDSTSTRCTGRIQFNSVIVTSTDTYNITILHNGNRSGDTFRTKHGGGGGGVAYAPTPTNNTTATTAESKSVQ